MVMIWMDDSCISVKRRCWAGTFLSAPPLQPISQHMAGLVEDTRFTRKSFVPVCVETYSQAIAKVTLYH